MIDDLDKKSGVHIVFVYIQAPNSMGLVHQQSYSRVLGLVSKE